MADNDISVASVEVTLRSEIGISSAIQMKSAYLPQTGEINDDGSSPRLHPGDSLQEEGQAGPNARVYITKIATRTPDEEIEQLIRENPDCETNTGTHGFYTLVLATSIRLGDLSTSHFINGTVDIALPEGIQILTYSPRERGIISSIIEKQGDAISLSPGRGSFASAIASTKRPPDPKETRFGIPVGPDEKITGSYSKKRGYSLDIPAGFLLEYQGMPKKKHAMYWEIYPPMPPNDVEITGKNMLTVMSLVIRAPANTPLAINVRIECRVKGDLWGVIPIKGSALV